MTTTLSFLDRPPESARAQFAPDFGQRVLLTVDTEEEFDWDAPFQRDGYGLDHIERLARFQSFAEKLGVVPLYLVDWPIVNDARAVEILGDAVGRGAAEIGVQLHPWVNPPFDEEVTVANSYAGNLPRELERAKFQTLRDKIEEVFGTAPTSYRAGRYGLGADSHEMLEQSGIAIDTSVRSLFDYRNQHGPDFSRHPVAPYWLGNVLELPVTTVYWGLLRQLGPQIHGLQRHFPTFFTALPKFGILERIALTPEGVGVDEAIRGIDIALDAGNPLLVLSFHSPSLAPGKTPYVENEDDVEALYDWFSRIYAYLGHRGVTPTSTREILAKVER